MKRTFFSLLIVTMPLFLGAQNYRIEELKNGGYYLIQTVEADPKDPNSIAKEYPQRFNTKDQLFGFVDNLRKQAVENREQAKKLIDQAPLIEAAATAIEETGKQFFAPKQELTEKQETAPPSPTTKNKKGKTP